MGQEVFDVSEEAPDEDEWTVVPQVYEDDALVQPAVVLPDARDVVDAVAMAVAEAAAPVGEAQVVPWSRKME